MEVCMKCSRKCLLRKKCAESPQISSFFKVMFGNKFSERLFLPPKFVRIHKFDVGRKMILKDSSRQRWNVVLSCIDGGLAFLEGWNMFSITHGIEEGDFVVFHYAVESSSQFTVQIFGRSGCEKLSVENNKKVKTSRDASNLHAGYDPFCKTPPEKHPSYHCSLSEPKNYIFKRRDESEDVRMSSPVEERDPSHENIARGLARETVRDFMDDVSFMLDRSMNFSTEDVNEDIFDLSMFELPEKKTVAKEVVEMEGPSIDAKKCHIDEGYIFSNNIGLMTENKDSYPLDKEYASVPENSPDTEMAPSSSSLDREPFPSVPELREVVPVIEVPFLSLLKEHEYGTRRRTRTPTPTPCPMPTTQSSKKAGKPRRRPRVVKQEPKVVNQELRITAKQEVLIEEHQPLDIIPATVASITCSVQEDKDFFLLSEPLPVKSVKLVKREKKVVYLYDPVGRTWPVLYHQNHGSNVLASGWDVFRKANDIQTGNTCTFSLPDVDEPVFAVTIHSLLYLN